MYYVARWPWATPPTNNIVHCVDTLHHTAKLDALSQPLQHTAKLTTKTVLFFHNICRLPGVGGCMYQQSRVLPANTGAADEQAVGRVT